MTKVEIMKTKNIIPTWIKLCRVLNKDDLVFLLCRHSTWVRKTRTKCEKKPEKK